MDNSDAQHFVCIHCNTSVKVSGNIGTAHRNHCPGCLWSLHVDDLNPGDRKSDCKASMEPIGLTLKREGVDKYGKPRIGELMIVHRCSGCGKININRIASDDSEELILHLLSVTTFHDNLISQGIVPLTSDDTQMVKTQLFGHLPDRKAAS